MRDQINNDFKKEGEKWSLSYEDFKKVVGVDKRSMLRFARNGQDMFLGAFCKGVKFLGYTHVNLVNNKLEKLKKNKEGNYETV